MTNLQTSHPNTCQLRSIAASDYSELQRIAGALLRFESPANLMDASDLLHDAILRLLKTGATLRFDNWDHLRRTAVCTMRRTLVDQGRARRARKRAHISTAIHESVCGAAPDTPIVLARDLLSLEPFGSRLRQVVELKLFSRCTLAEIATELQVCSRTVRRDWKKACEVLAGDCNKGPLPRVGATRPLPATAIGNTMSSVGF